MHPNKSLKNWLIYKVKKEFLNKYRPYYGKTLYDFGCGEMPYRKFFLQFVKKYVGVDWSDSQHKITADIVSDLNKPLAIESEIADSVISLSVLEHLCEPQNMLCEAYRILKPGGYLVLEVPWQWWLHEEPYDYFRYTPFGLKYMLKKAGFNEIYVEASSGFFTMWFLKLNYFSNRLICGPKPVKITIRLFFAVFWTILQAIAPVLDRIDRDWFLEAHSYWVTAKK